VYVSGSSDSLSVKGARVKGVFLISLLLLGQWRGPGKPDTNFILLSYQEHPGEICLRILVSSAAQPLKQAHRESPICTGLRIRTLLQKLISRLMFLFNVASSKLNKTPGLQMTSYHARLASSFRKPKQTQMQSGCVKPGLQTQCSAMTAGEEIDSRDNVSGHRHLFVPIRYSLFTFLPFLSTNHKYK